MGSSGGEQRGAGAAEQAGGAAVPESVIGADDRVRVSDTTEAPWRQIGRVSVTAETGVFTGTGFLGGPYHMLTAGHVVESAAFGGDGRAESLTVAFGQDGALRPFATAEAVVMRPAPAWSAAADPGADWALVTLDRSLGAALGSFDLAAYASEDLLDGAVVTLAGYPGDLSGGTGLYAASGTVADATADRLFYAGTLDTAGGMSGAPVWQSFSGSGRREVLGVHATGAADPDAPGAVNGATRLTQDAIDLLGEWIAQDGFLAPPVDLPDIADADAAFGTETAALSAIRAAAGETVELTLDIVNLGTAEAAPEIAVYLSTNEVISEFDIPLGGGPLAPLAAFETRGETVSLAIPSHIPAGFYRIGWILSETTGTDRDAANDTGLHFRSLEIRPRADLVVEEITLSALSAQPGERIEIDWVTRNIGAAVAVQSLTGINISTDAFVDRTDRRIGFDQPGRAIPAGATDSPPEPISARIPDFLAPGRYWIAVIADANRTLDEADTTNNVSAAVPITIGLPGLDLAGDAGGNVLVGAALDDTLRGFAGDDTLRGGDGADLLEGGGDDNRLLGEAGPDRLIGFPGFDTLLGQDGDDSLTGDLGDGIAGQGDVLNGGAGDDTLLGEGGPDTLFGEGGDDRLEGGPGFDLLNGNAGDDTLLGGDLRDTVDGEGGDDLLLGEAGNDAIFGGDGADSVLAGPGPDFVDGEAGDDTIDGGEDDDILLGGPGADALSGGAGDDILRGGSEGDLIEGGPGADRAYAETGDDTLDGGDGPDFFNGNEGDDLVAGGAGDDILRGDDGADTVLGGEGADRAAGGAGDDRVEGGPGDDLVDGDAGNDTVLGGEGADAVLGKAGADRLEGGPGDDSVFGGNDSDTLEGGPGADLIAGDAGVDSFLFRAGDGADLVFDFEPGLETLVFAGGVSAFADLAFGTDPAGWLTVGYAGPGDVVTLQGVLPGGLADDGSVIFA